MEGVTIAIEAARARLYGSRSRLICGLEELSHLGPLLLRDGRGQPLRPALQQAVETGQ